MIAEIGVNHDGEVGALMLTDAAADAGADAVKLRLFETDRLMSKAAKLAAYQNAGETDPLAMLRRLGSRSTTWPRSSIVRTHAASTDRDGVQRGVGRGRRAARVGRATEREPDIINRPLLGDGEYGQAADREHGGERTDESRGRRAGLRESAIGWRSCSA